MKSTKHIVHEKVAQTIDIYHIKPSAYYSSECVCLHSHQLIKCDSQSIIYQDFSTLSSHPIWIQNLHLIYPFIHPFVRYASATVLMPNTDFISIFEIYGNKPTSSNHQQPTATVHVCKQSLPIWALVIAKPYHDVTGLLFRS